MQTIYRFSPCLGGDVFIFLFKEHQPFQHQSAPRTRLPTPQRSRTGSRSLGQRGFTFLHPSTPSTPIGTHVESKWRSISWRFKRSSPSASKVWKINPMASRRSWLACGGTERLVGGLFFLGEVSRGWWWSRSKLFQVVPSCFMVNLIL